MEATNVYNWFLFTVFMATCFKIINSMDISGESDEFKKAFGISYVGCVVISILVQLSLSLIVYIFWFVFICIPNFL